MPKLVNLALQRRKIAEAAITTIGVCGLDRTGLRDVARAGNMTTGTVMHYFDNKDGVLEAALEEIVRRTLDRMETIVPLVPDKDFAAFADRVCCYLPVDKNSRREWRVWLAFWGRAIGNERLRATHREYYQKFVDSMIGLLNEIDAPGSKTPKRVVRNCADAIIAALDGVGTRATLEPEEWPPGRQRQTLKSLLIPLLTDSLTPKDPRNAETHDGVLQ